MGALADLGRRLERLHGHLAQEALDVPGLEQAGAEVLGGLGPAGHREALVRFLRESGAQADPIGAAAPPDPDPEGD